MASHLAATLTCAVTCALLVGDASAKHNVFDDDGMQGARDESHMMAHAGHSGRPDDFPGHWESRGQRMPARPSEEVAAVPAEPARAAELARPESRHHFRGSHERDFPGMRERFHRGRGSREPTSLREGIPQLMETCKALDAVPQEAQEEEWYMKAKKLCMKLHYMTPEQLQMLPGVAAHKFKGLAQKELVKKCQFIKEAAKNGKLDWFETQGWYDEVAKMCETIKHKSPEEVAELLQEKRAELEETDPAEVQEAVKRGVAKKVAQTQDQYVRLGSAAIAEKCEMLNLEKPKEYIMALHPNWTPEKYSEVMGVCKKIQGKSPEEVKGILADFIDTMSEAFAMPNPADVHSEFQNHCAMILENGEALKDQPWYNDAAQMCAVLKDQTPESLMGMAGQAAGKHKEQVKVLGTMEVVKKCQDFENAKQAGKLEWMQDQEWFAGIQTACEQIKGKSPEQLDGLAKAAEMNAGRMAAEELATKCNLLDSEFAQADFIKQSSWYEQAKTYCKQLKEGKEIPQMIV